MTTQANFISDLMAKMTTIQIAQNELVVSNTQSGNLVSTTSVAAIQTAINTVNALVNALTPTIVAGN